MNHLIIGYGYCGYHLATQLCQQHQNVITVSRHLDEALRLPGVTHLLQDVLTPLPESYENYTLYYLIPPPAEGREDTILRQFLSINSLKPAKVVYFGSSGVYGDQQGRWVDEQTSCQTNSDRQLRRLDAEAQWARYCEQRGIPCMLLRVAGIYGPNRLPGNQTPRIQEDEAPYSNHIYVKDLVNIAARLTTPGLFNVADGQPHRMGYVQQQVALARQLSPAPALPFAQVWQDASPMKREFMQSSKRLCITALQQALPGVQFTPLMTGIKESLCS